MIPPWMIEELEQEREQERERDRVWIDAPCERASRPDDDETVSDRRGVEILDISPIGENVTLL